MKGRTIIIILILITFSIFNFDWTESCQVNDIDKLTESLYIIHEPIIVANDSAFDLYGFPGEGTSENPYIIEGYNITTTDEFGIEIWNNSGIITKCFTIRNCLINALQTCIFVREMHPDSIVRIYDNQIISSEIPGQASRAIIFSSAGSVEIINNNCEIEASGIFTHLCSDILIESNEIYGLGVDTNIYFAVTVQSSNFTQIIGNNFFDSNVGSISVSSCSSGTIIKDNYYTGPYDRILISNCENIQVRNNTAYDSSNGLYLKDTKNCVVEKNFFLESDGSGIVLQSSDDILIHNNTIEKSDMYGIWIQAASENNITNNIFHRNSGWAIWITQNSNNNTVHHNKFINNNIDNTEVNLLSQSSDFGMKNSWYDASSEEGNYWSDWSGNGTYKLDGSAGSEDLYPLDSNLQLEKPTEKTNSASIWFLMSFFFYLTYRRKKGRKNRYNFS